MLICANLVSTCLSLSLTLTDDFEVFPSQLGLFMKAQSGPYYCHIELYSYHRQQLKRISMYRHTSGSSNSLQGLLSWSQVARRCHIGLQGILRPLAWLCL